MTASKVTQSKPTTASEVRLVEVLDAYLAAAQEGQAPSREDLLAEHPELAEDLEACLASLEFIGKASLTAAPVFADFNATEADEGEAGIGDLGDFRLVREVGRGGMGVVYEAVQRSLNRRVALKVLPFAAAMDPTQLRRFHTEALAAAQLHHTHIVPVYSVGCERGVHYYAMQFIEGQTLAQAIAERRRLVDPALPAPPSPLAGEGGPQGRMGGALACEGDPQGRMRRESDHTQPNPAQSEDGRAPGEPQIRHSSAPTPSFRSKEYFRMAAALGIQAAGALDHAHKVGIVHRDIKPANLLLDVQGSLWVTDFGLARLRDDAGLTITGDLLGTLRYMSPEQALAKRMVIDHRTDIYSLGATLYELVTFQPAFGSRDRQELLIQIADLEPQPPRKLSNSIPRELETIILKAMSKEPAGRFQTAQELADDLRRFLEHKPIRAKRPTGWERAMKWGRRHTTVVLSITILLALSVLGLAASTALIATKQAEVVHQRDHAHRQEERARRIVDEVYTRLSERWLADDPGDAELRREFLEKAAAYYEEFARSPATATATRLEVAHAWLRVGQINWTLRRIKSGEDAFHRAIDLFTDLVGEKGGEHLEARDGQIRAMTRLGDLLAIASRNAEAEVFFRRTLGLSRSLVARHPDHHIFH